MNFPIDRVNTNGNEANGKSTKSICTIQPSNDSPFNDLSIAISFVSTLLTRVEMDIFYLLEALGVWTLPLSYHC